MPELSVVVTAFNLEHYLAACFEELFSQTFQNFDIIVLDDCSTDRTADILRDYIARYPDRVKGIFGQTNLGSPGKARNAIMDSGLLNGKYTVFLDGDDSIEPDFLEKLYRCAREHDAEIAFCAYDRVIAETGLRTGVEMRGFPAVIELPPQDDVLAFFNGSLWNKLFRTDILLQERIPDLCAGEDVVYQYLLFPRCSRIASVDEVLFHYRMRSGSAIFHVGPDSVFRFADGLEQAGCRLRDTGYSDSLALSVFMHIGLSMVLYACNNRSVDMRHLLSRIRSHFKQKYGYFRGCRFLRFRSLRRHGARGYAIWLCRLLYASPLFTAAVLLYHAVICFFRIDLRFWMYHTKKLLW